MEDGQAIQDRTRRNKESVCAGHGEGGVLESFPGIQDFRQKLREIKGEMMKRIISSIARRSGDGGRDKKLDWLELDGGGRFLFFVPRILFCLFFNFYILFYYPLFLYLLSEQQYT